MRRICGRRSSAGLGRGCDAGPGQQRKPLWRAARFDGVCIAKFGADRQPRDGPVHACRDRYALDAARGLRDHREVPAWPWPSGCRIGDQEKSEVVSMLLREFEEARPTGCGRSIPAAVCAACRPASLLRSGRTRRNRGWSTSSYFGRWLEKGRFRKAFRDLAEKLKRARLLNLIGQSIDWRTDALVGAFRHTDRRRAG